MSIVIRIKGGIGNQLFIYAAARRLALFNKQELLLDHISGFVNDEKYRRKYQLDHFNITSRKASSADRLEPFSKIRRALKKAKNYFLSYQSKDYIKQKNNFFDDRILNLRLKKKLYLEGYFQSEIYFKDFEFQVIEDLKIIPPKDDLNNKIVLEIRKKSTAVAVHYRFFNETFNDTIEKNVLLNLHQSYYHKAIKKMHSLFPDAHYFIFSDKPEVARTQIPISNERMTLISHNNSDSLAFIDLWLMTQCQHFIIANSTFSWWGAWLSRAKNKIVIAPSVDDKYANWKDKKLLPKEWIQI